MKATHDFLSSKEECSNAEFKAFLKTLGWEDEGWIDHRGNFWPCDEHMKHGFIADCVMDVYEGEGTGLADQKGWLRVSDYGIRTAAKRLNQRQLNTLFDYCEHFKCDYQDILGRIEYLS